MGHSRRARYFAATPLDNILDNELEFTCLG